MGTRSVWWRRRVVVVTDEPEVGNEAMGHLDEIEAQGEVVSWRDAAERPDREAGGVVAIVGDPNDCSSVFLALAERALQPVTVAMVPPALGSTRILFELEALAFSHRVPVTDNGCWKPVMQTVEGILGEDAWQAAYFVRALGPAEPELVAAIAAALLGDELPQTAQAWATQAKRRLSQLEDLLSAHELAPPRQMLPRLRVWRAVVAAHTASHPLPIDRLAKKVGYHSGDYLGRNARTLTGIPFGELRGRPLHEAARLLATGAKREPRRRRNPRS